MPSETQWFDFPDDLSQFIGIISGSMIIENIFGIPGVDRYTLDLWALRPDYNFFPVAVSLLYAYRPWKRYHYRPGYGLIDPRIRMGARNDDEK